MAGGLFSISALDSATVNSDMKYVTAAQKLGNTIAPKTSAAIGSAVTSVENTALSYVGSAVKSALGSVTGFISSGETSIFSGIGSIFSSADNALASAVSGIGTLSTGTLSKAGTVVQAKGDAVTTLAKKNKPSASGYVLNGIKAGVSSVTSGINSADRSVASWLSGLTGASSGASSSDLQNATTLTALQQTLDSSHKSDLLSQVYGTTPTTTTTSMSRLYAGVSSALSSNSSSADKALSIAGSLGLTNTESSLTSMLKPIATSLGYISTNVSDFYSTYATIDTSLQASTAKDMSGKPVQLDDNTGSLDATTLNNINALATNIGCNNGGVYASYGNTVNAYNTLMNIAAKMGLSSLMTNLSQCATLNGSSSSLNNAKGLFGSTASSYPATAIAILDMIGNKNVATTPNLLTSIVSNSQTSNQTVATQASNLLTQLGAKPSTVYGTGSTAANDTVWDASILNASPTTMTDTYTGSNILSLVNSGSDVSIGSDGTLVSGSLY